MSHADPLPRRAMILTHGPNTTLWYALGSMVERAPRFLLVFVFLAVGCADTREGASPLNTADIKNPACADIDPFVCESEHGDRCSATSQARLDLEHGCHSWIFVRTHCHSKSACSDAETLARTSSGTPVLVRGCLGSAYDEIEAPSDALTSAAGVACPELGLELSDAECREQSVEDCPVEKHCVVSQGHRFDADAGCVDYDDPSEPECRAWCGQPIIRLVRDLDGGLWEFPFPNCPPRSWDELWPTPEGFIVGEGDTPYPADFDMANGNTACSQ